MLLKAIYFKGAEYSAPFFIASMKPNRWTEWDAVKKYRTR